MKQKKFCFLSGNGQPLYLLRSSFYIFSFLCMVYYVYIYTNENYYPLFSRRFLSTCSTFAVIFSLSFFPFIYWPLCISFMQEFITLKQSNRISNYIHVSF